MPHRPAPPPHARLFQVAYARTRKVRCYSCICLDPAEKAYQARVFQLAKAWHRMLEAERRVRRSG